MQTQQLVISSPDILGGTPVFIGTRVPVLDPPATPDDEGRIVEGLRKVTFYKQSTWRYEKEVRILRFGSGIRPFPMECFEGVIAGCRTTPRVRKKILEVATAKNIKAYQACESSTNYDIALREMKEGITYMSSMF